MKAQDLSDIIADLRIAREALRERPARVVGHERVFMYPEAQITKIVSALSSAADQLHRLLPNGEVRLEDNR